jgi:hypothetical protein
MPEAHWSCGVRILVGPKIGGIKGLGGGIAILPNPARTLLKGKISGEVEGSGCLPQRTKA